MLDKLCGFGVGWVGAVPFVVVLLSTPFAGPSGEPIVEYVYVFYYASKLVEDSFFLALRSA